MITQRRSGQWVTAGLLALLIALPARTPAEEPKLASATELKEVAVEHQPDATIVHITTSGAAKYHAEFMDSPSRLVVDLEDTVYAWRKAPLPVTEAPVKQIRGAQYRKGIARLVIEFTRKVGYAIREDEDGLTIVVPRVVADASTAPKPLPLKSPVVAEAPAEPKDAPSAASAEIKPMPVLPAPVKPAPIPRPAARVVAQAPAQAQAPAPAPTPVAPPPAATGGPHLISLDFKDADVINLLRILAAESGRNIVIGDDVKGKMSIALRNVPWELALDTILSARGLEKVERGGVMRIVSTEQLTKEREARARVEEAKLKGEAEVRAKLAEAQVKEAEAVQRKLAAEAAQREQEAQGTLRLLLPLGGLRGKLALDRFGLFDLGLGQLRPHFRLALQLRLFYAGPRLALLGQLLGGDDAHHAAALDLLETPRAQNRIERELPGHVAERDRHLALHVVADDDVPAALGGKDAEQVDDVGVLEVERDEMRAARGRRRRNDRRGRRSRGLRLSWRLGHHPRGRPRDRRGLHRRREHRHRLDLRWRSRRRVLGLGRRFGHHGTLQGQRLGSRGGVGDHPRDHDRQTVLVLTDRVPDLAGELDDEAGDPLPVLRAADLFHRRLGDGQGRLAPRIHGVFEIDDEPARRIHELGVILGGAGRRDVHDRRVGLMFDGDLFELSR